MGKGLVTFGLVYFNSLFGEFGYPNSCINFCQKNLDTGLYNDTIIQRYNKQ